MGREGQGKGKWGARGKGRKGRKGKRRGGESYIFMYHWIKFPCLEIIWGQVCTASFPPCISYQINFLTNHESYYVACSFNKSCSHFEMIAKVKIVHKNEQVSGLHILPPLILPSPWPKPQHFLPCWMLAAHNWWKGPLLLLHFTYKHPQQWPHSAETSASFMKQLLAQPLQPFKNTHLSYSAKKQKIIIPGLEERIFIEISLVKLVTNAGNPQRRKPPMQEPSGMSLGLSFEKA